MKRQSLLLILLLIPALASLAWHDPLPIVHAQTGVSKVYLLPVSQGIGSNVNNNLTVQVRLNLTEGESINAVDVVLNYTTYQGNGVLLPLSIDYSSSNIFVGSNVNVLSECIDGVPQHGTNCPSGEGIGTVHFAEVLIGSTLSGPDDGTLFQVKFKIVGTGASYFSVGATLVDPGVFPEPVSRFIPLVASGGVFGNTGVVAFYKPVPISGPSLLPGQDITFDATGSLTNSTLSDPTAHITDYAWSFGDGSSLQSTSSARMTHVFGRPGSFPVTLTVTDSTGKSGVWSNVVTILPALGSLKLVVVDKEIGHPITPATAQLFNGTQTLHPMTASLDSSGHAVFEGLVLGTYILKVSSPLIETFTKTENVGIVGWPTQDTLYLTVPRPGPNILGEWIFIGSLIAGAGIVAVGVVVRHRNAKKMPVRRNGAKRKRR